MNDHRTSDHYTSGRRSDDAVVAGASGGEALLDGPVDRVVTDPLDDYTPAMGESASAGRPTPIESGCHRHLVQDAESSCEDELAGGPPAERWTAVDDLRLGYFHGRDGIGLRQRDRGGRPVEVQLSNWDARILADVTYDDGTETTRRVRLKVTQSGRTGEVDVPIANLPRVQDWALEAIGSTARIGVVRNVQQHLLNAVQETGQRAVQCTVYQHSGWRVVDGVPVFLDACGAVSADGRLTAVEVALPSALEPLELPLAESEGVTRDALRTALGLLALAPDPVTVCVFGSAWRAPLGESQLAVWVTGATGAGKSEVTALAQQHFGAGFSAQHLPAAWSGTGNSINELAYLAKDVLLTVDDFVPKGSAGSVARLHATAEAVIRAQGNGAGRSRLDADAQLRGSRPPRATLLASGEDVPAGQSLRGRMVIVDLGPHDLDFTALSPAQRAARDGVLATAMGGYIRWLAGHPKRLANIQQSVEGHREGLPELGSHRRTATLLAELALAWRTVLDYAVDCAALTVQEAEQYWTRIQVALVAAGQAQSDHDSDADPAVRFTELVSAALASGRAHLADTSGLAPVHPQRWGWRTDNTGPYPADWRAQGPRVGYVDGDNVYLLPDAVLGAIADSTSGDRIAISKKALSKRLHERGILLAGELSSRQTLVTRKTLEKRRMIVWHLLAHHLGVVS